MDFFGVPMVCRAIQTALDSEVFDKVFVSTDSEYVSQLTLSFTGVALLKRSLAIQGSCATVNDVIRYHINDTAMERFERMCVLYPCTPLLEPADLRRSFLMFTSNDASRCAATKEYQDHPAYRAISAGKYSSYFVRELRRSEIAIAVNETYICDAGQFYWIKRQTFLDDGVLISDSPFLSYPLPQSKAVDINTIEDLELAEYYYSKK